MTAAVHDSPAALMVAINNARVAAERCQRAAAESPDFAATLLRCVAKYEALAEERRAELRRLVLSGRSQ